MSTLHRFAARLFVLLPLAVFVSACEHNAVAPPVLSSLVVARNPDTLTINTERLFTAIGRDETGAIFAVDPAWSVAAGGGTIDAASGVFTAGSVPGDFANTITATAGGLSATASVTVLAGAPASITITPATQSMATLATQQFTAEVRDGSGNVLAVVPNWSLSAGGGSIDGAGLFTAGSTAGTFTNTVTASVGTLAAFATVTVTSGAMATIVVTPNPRSLALSGTQQFTAVGRDADGNVVVFTPDWSIVAGGGTISGSGQFTAGTVAGTFANTVRACSANPCIAGSIAAFATVTVDAGALATIAVTPNPVAVGTDATQMFTAVGRDASGNIVPILPAPVWTVVPGYEGGTFTPGSSTYTAPPAPLGAFGFDTVRATSGSISGSARVNLSNSGALVSIAVTPNPATVIASGTQQFSATGFDASGLVVPTPGLAWSIVPSVGGGTINSGTGLFTAGAVDGTFSNAVQATSGGVSGYATVVISPPPPPGPSLGAAETHGLLAGSQFTCAGAPGTINADASVWPGSSFSGFPPCVITGATHAADAFAQTAQGDLTTAYDALASLACGTTITADLGGTTLAPGVYCALTSVGVTGTVTLDGNGDNNALFVIRAPSTLTTAGSVLLQNGAQAKNVYWWVGSSATLGTGSAWQGNILALQSITLVDNVTLCGRALARNAAVNLGTNNTISLPPAAAATCP